MRADPAKLLDFWTGLHNSEEGRRLWHEHKQLRGKDPRDLTHTLPLVLHEDAGPYSKGHSMVEVSFSSLTGKGTDLQTKFLSFAHLKLTNAELDASNPNRAWHRFIDSLTLLADGVHPPGSTLEGQPLVVDASGVRWDGIALFGKADGDQLFAWGVTSWHGSDEVCGYCLGNRSSRPYTDLRMTATSRTTESTSTESFLSRMRRPHHPLVSAIFVTFWFFRADILHLWDCKGVWPLLLGSVLWLLVHKEHRLGASQAARLQIMNTKKNNFYTAFAVQNRMPALKLSNLMDAQGFANLSGQTIKAANTRAL